MKKMLSAVIILFTFLALSGCGGSSRAVDEPHDNFIPELRIFDIVDSYGTDTAIPASTPLIINPYVSDGLFDVFWEVNSLEDYRVDLLIDNRSTLTTNSILIHSQVCGAGRRCDQSGGWVCESTSDFYMACGDSVYEKYIYPIIFNIPQQAYLFLRVCDLNSNYCEYDYYPVTLE